MLETRNTSTTTKTRVAYGNFHLCVASARALYNDPKRPKKAEYLTEKDRMSIKGEGTMSMEKKLAVYQ